VVVVLWTGGYNPVIQVPIGRKENREMKIFRNMVLVVVLAVVLLNPFVGQNDVASRRMLSNNYGVPACTPNSVAELQIFVDGTECGCSSGEYCYILHYDPIGVCTHSSGVPAQWKTLEWWCYNPRENFAQMAFFRGRN